MHKPCLLIASFTLALSLAACKPHSSGDSDTARASQTGQDELSLSASGHSKAKLRANGDLIIDGTSLDLTPEQRQLTLTYYNQMQGIARAGQQMGKQGASLAGAAASNAIKGVLGGKTDEIEARMQAEAEKMKAEAKKMCQQLVSLRTAQDALAAQLPAFRPYATITTQDINDCESS